MYVSGYLKGDANPLTYSITSDVKKNKNNNNKKNEQRNKQNKTTNTSW